MDLPWYAGLNLLALLVLWGMYWLDQKLRGTGAWMRGVQHGLCVLAIFFLVAGSRWGDVSGAAGAPVVVLAGLLLLATLWEVFTSVVEAAQMDPGRPMSALYAGDEDEGEEDGDDDLDLALDEGVEDLDAGTHGCRKARRARRRAVGKLLGGSSGQERLRGLVTLMALNEEKEGEARRYAWGGIPVFLGVLALPCYHALRAIGVA